MGGRACCNGVKTRGSWNLLEVKRLINELELIEALYAVQAFTSDAYINHGGGTISAKLTRLSAMLTECFESWAISIEAVYQGKWNIIVDEVSRAGPDAGD